MEPEDYTEPTLEEEITQLEEKISQLFYDYGYLATEHFVTIGEDHYVSKAGIDIDHNGA